MGQPPRARYSPCGHLADQPSHRVPMAVLAQVWTTHFEHVLEAVLRALQHADDKLREQAAALGVGVGVG